MLVNYKVIMSASEESTPLLDGVVKSVVNGNTIKVAHPQRPEIEKLLVLADVKTPRIAGKTGEDEVSCII